MNPDPAYNGDQGDSVSYASQSSAHRGSSPHHFCHCPLSLTRYHHYPQHSTCLTTPEGQSTHSDAKGDENQKGERECERYEEVSLFYELRYWVWVLTLAVARREPKSSRLQLLLSLPLSGRANGC